MSLKKIRPLNDRVIIKPKEKETTSAGGIVLPSSNEKPETGEVLAVGPGKYEDGSLRKLDVKVGDEVIFGKYSGTEVKVGESSLVVMREEDIMGVIEN